MSSVDIRVGLIQRFLAILYRIFDFYSWEKITFIQLSVNHAHEWQSVSFSNQYDLLHFLKFCREAF